LKDGFALKLSSESGPWEITLKRKGEGVYEERYPGIETIKTISRCQDSDIIAGIGLPPGFSADEPDPNFPGLSDIIKTPDGIFSAAYARAVPSHCPQLKADQEKTDQLIQLGRMGRLKVLIDRRDTLPEGWTYERQADEDVSTIEDRAKLAAEEDAAGIDSFCKNVLEVYGPHGRLISNLLSE
jgi:hypothetical protein